MTRRFVLQMAGVAAAVSKAALAAERMPNLGGAPAGFPIRFRMSRARGTSNSFEFVDYCHGLGLGVVETRLDTKSPEAVKALRGKVEGYGMRLILDIPLPKSADEVSDYDSAVAACKEAGAIGMHAAMTGRRYEQFDSLEAFEKDFARCQRTVEWAEPVLRKHRIRLAIENHKGWRAQEQAAWMKRVGSEWVGVHFDFGNNLSLCETPMETLRALQPYTFSCHIKDMAVEPYEDGFLLSEVPLGDGLLNLRAMVDSLRQKDPNMPFDLEMITRDPLKIPILTDRYWATFDERVSPLPGRDVARIIELVRKNPPKSPLPRTTGMSPEAQLKLEDENIAKSIDYARQHLGM